MTNAEDTKREKAKKLRYKKPIARGLNLMTIKEKLYDIQDECEEVHWIWDTDEETLINALDGNEDEAYEFKMMFSDLCGEIENMLCDMNEEWVPKCFDIFFVLRALLRQCKIRALKVKTCKICSLALVFDKLKGSHCVIHSLGSA